MGFPRKRNVNCQNQVYCVVCLLDIGEKWGNVSLKIRRSIYLAYKTYHGLKITFGVQENEMPKIVHCNLCLLDAEEAKWRSVTLKIRRRIYLAHKHIMDLKSQVVSRKTKLQMSELILLRCMSFGLEAKWGKVTLNIKRRKY